MSNHSGAEVGRAGTAHGPAAAAGAIALVPNSGIQFLRFFISTSELQFVYRRFLEEAVTLSGERTRVLHALELEGGTMFHPVSRRPLTLETTTFMSGQQGVEPFLDAWMPVPFLRLPQKRAASDGAESSAGTGPSNWVRAYMTRSEEEAGGLTIVLAFDTAIATGAAAHKRADVAPHGDDVAIGQVFALSDRAEAVAQFLSEPWVEDWLTRQFAQRQAAAIQPSGPPLSLEHVARYLTYLSVLARTCGPLEARFLDTLSPDRPVTPVDVDMVLDVGNSRTAGVLVEAASGDAGQPGDANVVPLEVRDLSRPWLVHPSPVESRLEFNRPAFGDEALSRRSGRSGAFLWPSLVRIGREAVWLASRPSAREGSTGLASAKRHVADSASNEEAWRFVAGHGAGSAGPVVSGPLLAHLDERGELLGRDDGAMPAVRPRFSRSALFGLFVAELIVQALGQLNAPQRPGSAVHGRQPRRLRRVVLTMPFGASADERETILRRVRDAIDVVWQTCGWSSASTAVHMKPAVEIGFDEAMSAQLVYLFNEVTQKLRAPAADYVSFMGKSRPEHGARPALRIASLDIGGGTSGLTIVTYAHKDQLSVAPTLSCSARVRHGGDDALLAVIAAVISPALTAALAAKGLKNAGEFVHDALGVAVGGIEPDDRFARRFLAQYMLPIALVILKDHERRRVGARHGVRHTTIGQLAERAEGLSTALAAELESHAAEMGATGFRLAQTPLTIRPAVVSAAVRAALLPQLGELLEIVDAYDCDQVLLTGWVSRLPEVMDIALERLPDRSERIVPMHAYDVASWYPFARSCGRIGDPKSTAVVGALLASRSADLMQGVQLRVADLSVQAARQLGTARSQLAGRTARAVAMRAGETHSAGGTAATVRRLLARPASAPEVIFADAAGIALDAGKRRGAP